MPKITIEGPVINDLDKKRVLVREITDAAAKAYGLRKEIISVLIKENRPDNVAAGGKLLIDRHKDAE